MLSPFLNYVIMKEYTLLALFYLLAFQSSKAHLSSWLTLS